MKNSDQIWRNLWPWKLERGILSLTKCAKEIYSIKDRAAKKNRGKIAESERMGAAPRNRQPALFIIIKSRTSSTPHKRSEKCTVLFVESVFIDSRLLCCPPQSARGKVFSGTLVKTFGILLTKKWCHYELPLDLKGIVFKLGTKYARIQVVFKCIR